MKIFTFKRLIGLAAIGGFTYAHKQRGGEWTLDSVKDTFRHLWTSAADKLGPMRDEARETLGRGAQVGDTATRTSFADDRSQRAYGGYKRDDDTGRH
jgi:hypothetical protein